MYISIDCDLDELIGRRSDSVTTRDIRGELFHFCFQRWNRLSEYENSELESPDGPTLFFGLGSRSRARRIIQSGSGHRIYEPDPHRLALFLEEFPDFFSNNDWKVGTGLWLDDGFLEGLENVEIHPLLKKQYDPLPRLMIKAKDVFKAEQALLIQVGALLYRDVVESFKGNGVPLWPIQLDHWQPDAVKRQLSNSSVKRLFSINLIEDLAGVCAEADTEYVCWEIDPSTSPYLEVDEEAGSASSIYTYRKKNIIRLRAVGYQNVEYCPLASNTALRRPVENDLSDYECDVSFVGSSMRDNARERLNQLLGSIKERDEQGIEWDALDEWIREWTETRPDWDEDSFGTIYRKLEELGIPFEITLDGEWVYLPMIIGEYRAYQKRADVVETVGNHFELDVWGDSGWEDHVGDRGTYRGEAGHGRELTNIYNASMINLDVNRIYQPNIVTMRVFDVMACGSVVLSEEGEEIKELLEPGKDCVLYRTSEQLLGTIEALLADEERCRDIGDRALETIENNHTIAHRLDKMGLLPS